MKITEQDIVGAAQDLRDEDNRQLHVAPWHHHRRFHVPAWLVAVPAAAVIGFVFGLWVNAGAQPDAPLTALTDTVYIKVNEQPACNDSFPQQPQAASRHEDERPRAMAVAQKRQAADVKAMNSPRQQAEPMGRPVADDKIRYDLLLMN